MCILGEKALAVGEGSSRKELTWSECGHIWAKPTHRPRSLVQTEPPHLPVLGPHGIPQTGWLGQKMVLTALEAEKLKVLAGRVLARISLCLVGSIFSLGAHAHAQGTPWYPLRWGSYLLPHITSTILLKAVPPNIASHMGVRDSTCKS